MTPVIVIFLMYFYQKLLAFALHFCNVFIKNIIQFIISIFYNVFKASPFTYLVDMLVKMNFFKQGRNLSHEPV